MDFNGVRDLIFTIETLCTFINYQEYPFSAFDAVGGWREDLLESDDGQLPYTMTVDGHIGGDILSVDSYFCTDVVKILESIIENLSAWIEYPPHGISTPKLQKYLDIAKPLIETIENFIKDFQELFMDHSLTTFNRVDTFHDLASDFYIEIYEPLEELWECMRAPDDGPMFKS